jgi:high-affinity iron transporter
MPTGASMPKSATVALGYPKYAWLVVACVLAIFVSLPAVCEARMSGAQYASTTLRAEGQSLQLLLDALPARYANAQPAHDTQLAAAVRAVAAGSDRRVLELRSRLSAGDRATTAAITQDLARLVAMLEPTSERFQPWPLSFEVSVLCARIQRRLDAILPASKAPAQVYGAIESVLEAAQGDAASGREREARFALLRAWALYASGPGARLQLADQSLDNEITGDLVLGEATLPSPAGEPPHGTAPQGTGEGASRLGLSQAIAAARTHLALAQQTLDEVRVSRTTIVVNGAIIVFREGLEAILILAAISASFVGAKRHLRSPVLIGALAGLGATIVTWLVAQVMLHMLGNGGLQLQAVTGLIAIAVLLLVTNWFFHRVYWSEWIARFNRRRRSLERWDGFGFLSGQMLGLILLGLSSVYREGLETVLFLQALQTSAGTGATALGAGIGLGATLIVGTITFKLQRKLPFKRMLILTGVLIALVLAVMVGTTVHNLQGIGWLPTTPTAFSIPLAWSTWLGVFPTWEGLFAQVGSLVFVLGSYFAAREIQVKRPRRRAMAAAAGAAATFPSA